MTVAINDPEVQQFLREANEAEAKAAEPPKIDSPPDTVFDLHGSFLQEDGRWVKTFEVRELTGRDEEALAKIKDPGRLMTTLLERGLVRIGTQDATPGMLDDLYAGDWETILIALRIVTFGEIVSTEWSCGSCRNPYEAEIDLRTDIPIRGSKEDEETTVQGKRVVYEITPLMGSGQRKIMEMIASGSTVAELNTISLFECVQSIDGRPVVGMDAIRDLPMADRRALLDAITERRVGPDLQGVRTKCPTCGTEQQSPLSVAALFQN